MTKTPGAAEGTKTRVLSNALSLASQGFVAQ